MGETDDTSIGPIDASDEIYIKYDPEVDAELDFPLRQVEGQPGSFYGHFTPKLTPREKPKAIYYGPAAHLGANELLRTLQDRARRADVSERPDYLEWAEPPWHGLKRDVAPGEEWTHYCTQARREITTRFSKCSCGRTRGDNLGDGLLRAMRNRAQQSAAHEPGSMEEALAYFEWREPMVIGDEHNRERYPGGDTPQLWSRRGLSEHIRLELQVLGLLPGDDGFIRPPEPWEHYCREVGHPVGTTADVCAGCGTARGEVSTEAGVSEGVSTTEKSGPFGDQFWEHDCPARRLIADKRITLLLNRQCAECGAWAHACGAPPGPSGRQVEGPLIDWDNVDHFKINIDGEWIAVSKYHVQAVRKD